MDSIILIVVSVLVKGMEQDVSTAEHKKKHK